MVTTSNVCFFPYLSFLGKLQGKLKELDQSDGSITSEYFVRYFACEQNIEYYSKTTLTDLPFLHLKPAKKREE